MFIYTLWENGACVLCVESTVLFVCKGSANLSIKDTLGP